MYSRLRARASLACSCRRYLVITPLAVPQSPRRTIYLYHYCPPIPSWCARAGGADALARTGAGGLALILTLTLTLALALAPNSNPDPNPDPNPEPNPITLNPDPNPNLVQVGDGDVHGTADDPMVLSDVFVRGP